MTGGHGIAQEEGKRAENKEIQAGVGEPQKQTTFKEKGNIGLFAWADREVAFDVMPVKYI
jgi:hypothetical protein